jgi:lipoic acid synthetase
MPGSGAYLETRQIVEENRLHTVCQSAQCPNLGECWARKTATVMILGDTCTRSCSFCAVRTGRPGETDVLEPFRVARAIRLMNLKHAVITSVARDDLADGGAAIWAATIREVRQACPQTAIEVLIPDFLGKWECLDAVLDAAPDILNHNLETVQRLQREVRKTARYDRSRELLRRAKARGFVIKSGLMLGIGEDEPEIEAAIHDLAGDGLDILTLGQYLRPSPRHRPVYRWVAPEEFTRWKEAGLSLGIRVVESGPMVRSSYHADEQSATLAPAR